MHIKLQDLKEIFTFFITACLIAFFTFGLFYVLSLISWALCQSVVAVLFTPICYWILKCMQNKITIEFTDESVHKILQD